MNLLHGNKFSPWEDFPFGSDVINPNQLCKCTCNPIVNQLLHCIGMACIIMYQFYKEIIYLPCFDLSCMPLSLDLGVFGGLIIPAFSFRLSLSSPVYQVSCFVLYTWIRTQPAELPW